MQTIKVRTAELLTALQTNRTAHRGIFEEALVGYRAAVIAALEESLADARANRRIRQNLGLVEPMDQTKEYDRAIKMLEMSVDSEIELSQSEFACYVMDDWAWKGQFTASNTRYTNSTR